jgi:hypothetical protein
MFDAFFTTKPNGIGLGLSICRSIVESHGGQLSVFPAHPHGSVFQVMLPIGEAGAEHPQLVWKLKNRRSPNREQGGHLITSEFEPSKVARARHNLTAEGLTDPVEIREGDAERRAWSTNPQILRRGPTPIRDKLEFDRLPLIETSEASAFYRWDVNEHVLAAALRLDEAVTLLRIKPLHGTCRHVSLLPSRIPPQI